MPDKRAHRGRHPEDLDAFGPDMQPRLLSAVADLSWLLSRGYAQTSAVKIVGDRYSLRERQRVAVMRCACSDTSLARRREREISFPELRGQVVLIDGYNVLTTLEAALAGGVIIIGRDGCYRDMASMHGTFRQVNETIPAIRLIGELLFEVRPAQCIWYLDRPVSNSGRLKTALVEVAGEHDWPWTVEIVTNPDTILSSASEAVATADSVILDRCDRWCALAREAVVRKTAQALIADLSGATPV